MSKIDKPNGSKAVLLKNSKDGQCKAIIGYVDGKLAEAVYCGEDVVHGLKHGRTVPSAWCGYHKSIYYTEPKR